MARSRLLSEKSPIAFVGDYVPRQCGIATFTHDLCESVAQSGGKNYNVFTVATNDRPEGYPYPERVRFEIRQSIQADYRLAAEFLNIHQVSVVCVQHEYGIYGGLCGAHLLAMLNRLRRPLVTTLHTILKEPNQQQRVILQEIGRLSDRVVSMSETGQRILQEVYDLPAEKITVIGHGIPDVPFVDPNYYKDQFGVEGRKVLLTFGLLSPGKGIEYVMEALPEIVREHPEVVYIVLGATHPHVRQDSGEEYRNGLLRRVNELGVEEHVRFVNRFVETAELCEYLGAADLYVTPYLNEAQIVSGTLTYAMGAGKAIISTPYWYAQEMLSDGRGRLVPFRDSDAIGEQVLDLLDNETQCNAMRKKAYNTCRKMVWKQVAQDYLALFKEAARSWVPKVPAVAVGPRPTAVHKPGELPEVDLRHLRTMTDDTGMLQHCIYSTPDRSHGYCTDDNSRALIVAAMHWDQTHDDRLVPLMQTYLAFLAHAMNEKTGRFRNFMNYDRTWSEVIGSEDSHARALWGLGVATALCPHESMVALATQLFLAGLPAVESFASPRSWAFAVLGIHAYLRWFSGDSEARRTRANLSERLLRIFQEHMTGDWPWCEDAVTYANAKLPHALLMSGKWMGRNDMIDVGKAALEWLISIQTHADGMLSVVGNAGWYIRGGQMASHDQQPIEVHGLIDACIEAYHVTREERWLEHARRAFNWFLGENILREPVYDFTTGGCRDGLHADRVNENQGAESTVAWLMSLLLMHNLQMEQTLGVASTDMPSRQRPARKARKAPETRPKTKASTHAGPDCDDQ